MIGNHFKKKFSKTPPPGIIVTKVNKENSLKELKHLEQQFQLKIKSFKIEKYEIIEPI